jgi:hypothetical protein
MSVVTAAVAAVVCSYFFDRLGVALAPIPILLVALAGGAGVFFSSPRAWPVDRSAAGDLFALAVITLGVLAAIVWIAWPELLPVGGGSDLTHHLQLIDFLDRHHRLPHGAADAALVGNMINYTPGSHYLASLAGAWTRTDGLHAMYGVLAVSVALKAGLLFLIVRRALGAAFTRAAAVGSVVLLFLPSDLLLGSFTKFSFYAQVVAETFAVAMWLPLAVWNERPSLRSSAFFAVAGVGVFLSWPVWIGPAAMALLVLALFTRGVPRPDLLRYLAVAFVPVALVAALHATGRAESVAIVQSGGAAFQPTVARFTWLFLALSAVGLAVAVWQRSSGVTLVLTAAVAAQTAGLFVLARIAGADSPYMALKMMHFAIYPMAALAGVALGAGEQSLERLLRGTGLDKRWAIGCMWVLVIVLGVGVGRRALREPRPQPVVTESLFRAGAWARAHVRTDCVEYLVPQDSTSYWLHLAVLGNPSQPPPGALPPYFFYKEALVRWITKASYPVTIADLSVVPREVPDDVDVLARFGNIIVGRRPGASGCQSNGQPSQGR